MNDLLRCFYICLFISLVVAAEVIHEEGEAVMEGIVTEAMVAVMEGTAVVTGAMVAVTATVVAVVETVATSRAVMVVAAVVEIAAISPGAMEEEEEGTVTAAEAAAAVMAEDMAKALAAVETVMGAMEIKEEGPTENAAGVLLEGVEG